jgi:hypothetical protein
MDTNKQAMQFKLKSHSNRVIFKPRLDWASLSARAELDTVTVKVRFDGERHLNTVRALIKKDVGESANVRNKNGMHSEITVSLQDPNPQQLHSLTNLDGVIDTKIKSVDVAFDMHHGDKAMLLNMVQIFAWSLDVKNLGWTHYSANPRIWLTEKSKAKTIRRDSHRIGSEPLLTYETFYFGDRDKPGSVKAYLKTMNEGKSLSPSEYRARIEVVLKGAFLDRFELNSTYELATANLSKLRQLFRFKIPSVANNLLIGGVPKVTFINHYLPIMQAGIWLWDNQPEKRRRYRLSKGSRLWEPPYRKTMSYGELNKRVDKAFERLGTRWKNQAVPEFPPITSK